MPSPREYADKGRSYFANARRDYIDELEPNPQGVLLEIGCGEGATGTLALELGKCGAAYGVELVPEVAAVAESVLDEVLVGDVEQLDLPWPPRSVDVLILSEVLEHLRDPWDVLRRARPLLKSSAQVFASSPNVAHYRVIRMLLRGDWHLADFGPMDRTHLRWFTPKSYARMFEECGYAVERVGTVRELTRKARVADTLTFGRLRHLLQTQIDVRARPT